MPARPMIGTSPPYPAPDAANISPTTSTTKSAPSRNMTVVIRTVRPVSLMKREVAMGPLSPGSGHRR